VQHIREVQSVLSC